MGQKRVISNFNKGFEGWSTVDNGSDLERIEPAEGGAFVRGSDTGSGVWYFDAGREWTGDLERFLNGEFSFRIRMAESGSTFSDEDVRIIGTNGTTLTYTFSESPGTEFSTFRVRLDAYSGWKKDNGTVATANEIRDVLADVQAVQIRGDHRLGDDTVDLAKVVFKRGSELPGDDVSNLSFGRVKSTFDKGGGEGWSFRNDLASFEVPTAGGANGGYLRAVDAAIGQIVYYVAPEPFLGRKTGFYNGKLEFSLQVTTSGPLITDQDDVILSGGGLSLYYDLSEPSSGGWQDYKIRLNEDGGWSVGSRSGPTATREQIQTVLEDITDISIRAEYRNGPETMGLDDVLLSAPRGRYFAVDSSGNLLLVKQDFQTLLNLAPLGSTIHVEKETSGTFDLSLPSLAIVGNGKLSGTIEMTGEALALTATDTGDLTVIGQAATRNQIIVVSDTADFIKITGGNKNDDLIAEANAQSGGVLINGLGGQDRISGGKSGDRLFGGKGMDTLNGQQGNDTLSGGGGPDTFIFNANSGRDRILDFETGKDQIDFSFHPGISGLADIGSTTNGKGQLVLLLGAGSQIILEGYSALSDLDPARDFVF